MLTTTRLSDPSTDLLIESIKATATACISHRRVCGRPQQRKKRLHVAAQEISMVPFVITGLLFFFSKYIQGNWLSKISSRLRVVTKTISQPRFHSIPSPCSPSHG
jgi:hypothetical protein